MIEFTGILLGIFGISVMQLILATAMPFIVTEIGGDSLYSWVFSIYMLASLFTIPIFSKLADIYGKKQFFMLGMGLFAIGTLYGGFVPSMELLIIARVIQGLGAGMMIPVSIALISDMFPPEKRGNMIGLLGAVQLLANLVSPSLGSFFTKQLGWHWIFLTTFGAVILAMGLVASGKWPSKISKPTRWSDIDLAGGLLFGIFCMLVVGFSKAASDHANFGLGGVLLLVGVVITALALVWNETNHKNPVIKVEFFKTKMIRQAILSSLIAGGIMYGLVTLLPICGVILNREGFGVDESQILLVFMLGITVGMLIGSRLNSKLNQAFPKSLWGLSVIGAGLMYQVVSLSNVLLFNIAIGCIGLGLVQSWRPC
jgi:MFS family permease